MKIAMQSYMEAGMWLTVQHKSRKMAYNVEVLVKCWPLVCSSLLDKWQTDGQQLSKSWWIVGKLLNAWRYFVLTTGGMTSYQSLVDLYTVAHNYHGKSKSPWQKQIHSRQKQINSMRYFYRGGQSLLLWWKCCYSSQKRISLHHVFQWSSLRKLLLISPYISKCKSEHAHNFLVISFSKLRIHIVLTGFFWSLSMYVTLNLTKV